MTGDPPKIRLRTAISYLSFLVASALAYFCFFTEIFNKNQKDISLVVIGFSLGLFGSYIWEILEDRKNLNNLLNGVLLHLKNKDFLGFEASINEYRVLRDHFLYEVFISNKKDISVIDFFAKSLEITKLAQSSNWKAALLEIDIANNIISNIDIDRCTKEIHGFLEFYNMYLINRNAVKFYGMEGEAKSSSAESIVQAAENAHKIINDPKAKPLDIVERFNDLLDLGTLRDIDYDIAPIEELHSFITSRTVLMGVLGIVKEMPNIVLDEGERASFVGKLREEFSISIGDDIRHVNLYIILCMLVSHKYKIFNLTSAPTEISNIPQNICDRMNFPKALFNANRMMFFVYNITSLRSVERSFEAMGERCKDAMKVFRLNMSSILINRGLLLSEMEILKENMEKLSETIQGNEFYYDGYKLNLAIIKLFVGNEDGAANDIIEIAQTSNNYTVRSNAIQMAMKYSAKKNDSDMFNNLRKELESLKGGKGFISVDIEMKDALDIPIHTTEWYFCLIPAIQKYAKMKLNPWVGEIL